MAEKHNEAKVVAFSDIHYGNMRWSFTLREGVTQKQITSMLEKIKFATEAAVGAGFRVPRRSGEEKPKAKPASGPAPKPASGPAPKPASGPAPKPASGPAPKPASGPAPKPASGPAPKPASGPATESGDTEGGNANDNPLHVGGFRVSGTEENPVVELYSVNERLKYPVLRVPFAVLRAVVTDRYDVDLSALSVCGKADKVDWLVGWKPSKKNPKWRDLVKVEIPKLTPKREEHEDDEIEPVEPFWS